MSETIREEVRADTGHLDYGKSDIRLRRVYRDGDRHSFRDVRVDVLVEGRLRQGYVDGDNTDWLATDTIRHGVYIVADRSFTSSIEEFGKELVRHYVSEGPLVQSATVKITENQWSRIPSGTQGHDHAFVRDAGVRTATVSGDGVDFVIKAGITDLVLLKTTASGWENFLRDELTILPETDDRLLNTSVDAEWVYSQADGVDFDATWAAARDQLIETFADHYSPGLQNDMYLIGRAILGRVPEIERISFTLPNLHNIEYDLTRFGGTNKKQVFHADPEPYGVFHGEVVRA